MNSRPELHASDHEIEVERYYNENTPGIYLSGWNRDHIHFGLFEPGECPRRGESLVDSPGVARAVERMVDVIVDPAGISEGHLVVDAGCGVGGTAIHLAQTRGCAVTGVNLNRLQLEIAGKKVAEAGLEHRINLDYADCSNSLPFADECIDVVVNIESACHYSNRERFLGEVSRILKPSGKIVAMDWMAHDGLAADEYERYVKPLCKVFAVQDLESPSSYTAKLHHAGLEVLEFAGFEGKDADNLRLIEYSRDLLTTLQLFGTTTPGIRMLFDQFKALSDAWGNGSFELGRYCAQKPG